MSVVGLPVPEATGDDYFDVTDTLERLADGRAVTFPAMEMLRGGTGLAGLMFMLNMVRDPIQNSLRRGAFYEREELDYVAGYMRKRAHVIDIGSNIGNHALFFAKVMKAARVVVIEPNPLALAPLVANVVGNDLGMDQGGVIDMSHLGVGLSDVSEGGYWMKRHDRNLGATKLQTGGGRLVVRRGDDLFDDETPDLVKIDVEGMEMKVLAGMAQVITRNRPAIFIEVDEANASGFAAWCQSNSYSMIYERRDSAKNCNYLVIPDEDK